MSKTKIQRLSETRTLNPDPESVTGPLFANSSFFDPKDLLQIRYEMVRSHIKETTLKETAARYGMSVPTCVRLKRAYREGGLHALIPRRRGSRGPRKITPEMLDFAKEYLEHHGDTSIRTLAKLVSEQLRTDFETADRQRMNHIQALRHKVDLARRRFMEVDPSNRLVAATLEAEWEAQLTCHEKAVQEREAVANAQENMPDAELDKRILNLSRDFGKVWNATETTSEDRKRLLGLLVEDITLTRNGYEVEMGLRAGRIHRLDPVALPRSPGSDDPTGCLHQNLGGIGDLAGSRLFRSHGRERIEPARTL